MKYSVLTLLVTMALMLAMALTLILKPKELRKFNGAAVFFAGMVGLIFYGLGYGTGIHSFKELLVVAIQAVNDTISMFKGSDSYSSLASSAPWFAESTWMQIIYWLAILSAMYFTAAVILGTLGKNFLRFLRGCFIGWRQDIVVFYPNNDQQISLAESISKKKRINPVFIGACAGDKQQEKLDNIGAVILEEDQVGADGNWLVKLGLAKGDKKVMKLFVSGESDSKTKKFLNKVLAGMEKAKISSKSIILTVVCEDEQEFSFLTTRQEEGYYLQADIHSYKNIAAKVMIQTVAPWDFVSFDSEGNATNGFHAMILGFGQVGQSILCEMLRNSQFVGQKTKIQIVDNHYKEKAGAFLSIYKDMLKYFEVEFVEMDVFSEQFFDFLYEQRDTLNYVAISMGDDDKNLEAASQIRYFRNRRNGHYRKDMAVVTCSKKEVIFYDVPDQNIAIPNPKVLWEGTMDDGAKEIHKVYVKNKAEALYPGDKAKQQEYIRSTWYENDYSSRLSCASSASFIPAMYKAAGIDMTEGNPKAAMTKLLKDNDTLLENLSKMEHSRWNAFSYSMGVLPMTEEEFANRVNDAIQNIQDDVKYLESDNKTMEQSKVAMNHIYQATKYVRKELEADGFGGVHVCLTDWDHLDKVWSIYEPLASMVAKAEYDLALFKWAADGKKEDKPKLQVLSNFKQLDTNNIINLTEA